MGPFTLGRVHLGDAALVLRELPPDSFDAVIADPPYSSGGLWTGTRKRPPEEKYASWARAAAFAGDGRDQRSYGRWLAWWLAGALRVARSSAYVAVFTDWRQIAATVDALQMGGWLYRGIIPWTKRRGRYRPAPGFANAAEFVVWGGAPEFRGAPSILGVLEGEIGTACGHLTEKPVEILEALLTPCPAGGRVLDPFAGSGTAGVAAKRTGREYLGFELDRHGWPPPTAGWR